MRVPRMILVAVDLTPPSSGIADCARVLAGGLGAGLELLHVLPARYGGADARAVEIFDRTRARAAMRGLVDGLAADGVAARSRLERGEPVERILNVAAQQRSDLIVMGASGRGSLSQLFHGGVAEAVLRRASCPVVLVRGGERTARRVEPRTGAADVSA